MKPTETPYHVATDGTLEGYGKKLKPNNFKDHQFTIARDNRKGFLFIGSTSGHLHIYETKFLTHVNTFHVHQGAILALHVSEKACFFTGSDSKIVSLKLTTEGGQDNWVVSKQTRAQSHDIMAIELIQKQGNNFLISGGITTDICFYKVNEENILEEDCSHKISYPSDKLSQIIDNYLIVHKYNHFQIWKLGPKDHNTKDGI